MARRKLKKPKDQFSWLPEREKVGDKVQEGELRMISLYRWANDRTLHGTWPIKCCDCGLVHIHDFSVLKGPDGRFYLGKRAYRIDEDDAKWALKGRKKRS